MRDLITLVEAPIGNIRTYGDLDQPGSLRADDRGILQSPKAHEKIKRVLQKAPVLIELHFVNLPHQLTVDQHTSLTNYHRIGYMEAREFAREYGVKLRVNRNAVNLVYVMNEGGERMPFTPWIIAHRMSHAFQYAEDAMGSAHNSLQQLVDEFTGFAGDVCHNYRSGRGEFDYLGLGQLGVIIGTSKAARENKLTDIGEIVHEWLALLCVTGSIQVNPLPRRWGDYRWVGSVGELTASSNRLKQLAASAEEEFRDLLKYSVGSLVVI